MTLTGPPWIPPGQLAKPTDAAFELTALVHLFNPYPFLDHLTTFVLQLPDAQQLSLS